MKRKHATQIRRGILIALLGNDLDFKNEEPLTIEAYLRTASKERPIVMTHPTIDWDVQVMPQYVRHYLDDGWTIRKAAKP